MPAPPRSEWLSSRAFLVFADRERAQRLSAALHGLRVDGAILQATVLGRKEPPEAESARNVECEAFDLGEQAFPTLPEPAPSRTPIEAPRPSPRTVLCFDEDEETASTAASTAVTVPAVCSYCKRPGHIARCMGAIVCPLLASREEARIASEVAQAQAEGEVRRLERARDRAMARRMRDHDAETSGWTLVGTAHVKARAVTAPTNPPSTTTATPLPAATPPVAADLPAGVERAAPPAPLAWGVTDNVSQLSRAQKRMQRRKEKSRAKRSQAPAAP